MPAIRLGMYHVYGPTLEIMVHTMDSVQVDSQEAGCGELEACLELHSPLTFTPSAEPSLTADSERREGSNSSVKLWSAVLIADSMTVRRQESRTQLTGSERDSPLKVTSGTSGDVEEAASSDSDVDAAEQHASLSSRRPSTPNDEFMLTASQLGLTTFHLGPGQHYFVCDPLLACRETASTVCPHSDSSRSQAYIDSQALTGREDKQEVRLTASGYASGTDQFPDPADLPAGSFLILRIRYNGVVRPLFCHSKQRQNACSSEANRHVARKDLLVVVLWWDQPSTLCTIVIRNGSVLSRYILVNGLAYYGRLEE
ncbi:unnamed protein product [Protopolystoma xenopodis]|uniref:Uncharacterized protein n=1 Tax=Protopolystoma xenopodis TaxID=117903 RepID=A0A3S5FBL1_9PLAT|nr:unnamed protein product [Protopolystoma xenopodis]